MPKRARAAAAKSKDTEARRPNSFEKAREVLIEYREDLAAQIRYLDRTLDRLGSLEASLRVGPKKSLQEFFDARNQSQPGSREEDLAAERILEVIFPDTNAG